jgi:hypothetical protein
MYRYWFFVHILGVVAFMSAHGASMFTLFRVRNLNLDRAKIADAISFSGVTTRPMYISLLVIVVAGIGSAITGPVGFNDWWLWLAIAILVATIGLMTAIAAPISASSRGVRRAAVGVPRTSDEELTALLRSSTTWVITAIGTIGILVILYLMIFKPGNTF